jgi:peptidoglycan hydrolase-like protein with peptidoglycan-binding domain
LPRARQISTLLPYPELVGGSSPSTTVPTVPSQSTISHGGITLIKNYQLWDRSEDIRALQKFFNTHGFAIAQNGPGSPDNETSIFGVNTYRALIKFQNSRGLPQTGYLGPLTRAALGSTAASSTAQ